MHWVTHDESLFVINFKGNQWQRPGKLVTYWGKLKTKIQLVVIKLVVQVAGKYSRNLGLSVCVVQIPPRPLAADFDWDRITSLQVFRQHWRQKGTSELNHPPGLQEFFPADTCVPAKPVARLWTTLVVCCHKLVDIFLVLGNPNLDNKTRCGLILPSIYRNAHVISAGRTKASRIVGEPCPFFPQDAHDENTELRTTGFLIETLDFALTL